MTKFKCKFFYLITMLFFLQSCQKTEDVDISSETGEISLKIDGVEWKGAFVTGIVGDIGGGVKLLTINALKSKNDNSSESVNISIYNFTGPQTYTFDNINSNHLLRIAINGQQYGNNKVPLDGGGGEGTIKINKYTPFQSFTKFGEVEAEFSGTINSQTKPGSKITVTSGKLKAIIFS